MVRVSLDNIILNDTPKGWNSAKISSIRDNNIKGLFTNYTNTLEFWGDGFDYIDNVLNSDFCQTIEILIESDDCEQGVFVIEFQGIIQLTQINEYNVTKRIIKARILDESFDAKIRNNQSIKAFVDVGLSKNDTPINPVVSNNINFFLPTADWADYLGTIRKGFRVYDCFKFLIDYMTDGQVGFVSDLLSTTYYNWMLFNGKEIRVGNGGGDSIDISFKELFNEIDRKLNLGFSIEPDTYNNFRLRIEQKSFFEVDDSVLTLDNVKDILMSFNKDELYSHVEIGSNDFDENVDLSYPPINFKAFKEENYNIAGQCNFDNELNLVSSYIIDSNVIEDLLVNDNDQYDKKIFIVVTDGTNALKYKEYATPISIGTYTEVAEIFNNLEDSNATFISDGVQPGYMVKNTTTEQTAEITAVNSETNCTLDDTIFSFGDTYAIHSPPFNYNHPLTNYEVITRYINGLPNSVIKRISTSSTANFSAGITLTPSEETFPVTISPIDFDDDFTAPFFDDGNNYDVNFPPSYIVPSSGLYGFEVTTILNISGDLGDNEMVNGDFSSGGLGWQFTIGTINGSTEVFEIGRSFFRDPDGFLRQSILEGNNIYSLTFSCNIISGSIIVQNGISVVENSGTFTFILDFSDQEDISPFLQFNFLRGEDGNISLTIDDVILQKTSKFNIKQRIIRGDSSNVELQAFEDEFIFIVPVDVFRLEEILTTERTIKTFTGEKIYTELEIDQISGNNGRITFQQNTSSETIFKTNFKTIFVDDGGGDILPKQISKFPAFIYKFKKALKFSEFKTLLEEPEKSIRFSKNSENHLIGFRNKIEYDRKTGMTEFEVRSIEKINSDC